MKKLCGLQAASLMSVKSEEAHSCTRQRSALQAPSHEGVGADNRS